MRIGTQELIIILIVVIIIFGPTQIPKLTKMFGKSVKSFKAGLEEKETVETAETGKSDGQETGKQTEEAKAPDENKS